MDDRSRRTTVLSRHWSQPGSEAAFVMRSLAGALSRLGPVDVLVPGWATRSRPDGAFDVRAVGAGAGEGSWPDMDECGWSTGEPPAAVLVHADDRAATTLARAMAPAARVLALAGPGRRVPAADSPDAWLTVAGPAGGGAMPPGARRILDVGMHVAINLLAKVQRHNGLGFSDYLLVLSDRSGRRQTPDVGDRRDRRVTPLAAWLAARFPRDHVVVVESATAAVWRARSLRGLVRVDTRMDLWRLMAHARCTIDLGPGPIVGRECVESLRLGTPVVAPTGSAAEAAALAGGFAFRDVHELLAAVAELADPGRRRERGEAGQATAEARYGDPVRFVDRVGGALAAVGGPTGGLDP